MSTTLLVEDFVQVKWHWNRLKEKWSVFGRRDSSVDESIGVIDELILGTSASSSSVINDSNVSTQEFVSIMNEIDSETKENEEKDKKYHTHKDYKRMHFISAPVSYPQFYLYFFFFALSIFPSFCLFFGVNSF